MFLKVELGTVICRVISTNMPRLDSGHTSVLRVDGTRRHIRGADEYMASPFVTLMNV